jgi:branched-chain amino acid transport system ATP-binding protein
MTVVDSMHVQDYDLELSDIVVRYGHVSAVEGVSMAVARGAIVAVLGANGAGKTSLLNAVAGSSVGKVTGTVSLFGRPLSTRNAHRVVRAGMVLAPEGRQVFAPLSVEDNLLVGGYVRRGRRQLEQTRDEVFELFPVLRERRQSAAGLLSGGEQQMLAFGRAIMSEPKVILMDEPSMGLAPIMIDRVMAALTAIRDRGTSILVVEQNAAAVLEVATYAYVLEQGNLVHEGPSAEIRDDPIVMQAFLGLRESDAPPESEALSAHTN